MKQPTVAPLVIVVLICVIIAGAFLMTPSDDSDNETLYQVSTLEALFEGEYDGIRTVGDLKDHGNIGVGTFDRMNGEMILLDDSCYQVTSDGIVHEVEDGESVPFACVSYMDIDIELDIEGPLNMSELENRIFEEFTNQDFFMYRSTAGSMMCW